jgi:hypothetical protein
MTKNSALLSVFVLLVSVMQICQPASHASLASNGSYLMAVQDTLFAFGWSANPGEKWLVEGVNEALNNKALVVPPSAAIEGDAGQPQTNPNVIYINNIQFHNGWSASTGEKYKASTSMISGATQTPSSKGLLEPPTLGDAGLLQTNPSFIYVNNVGFSFAWSPADQEGYRPSSSLLTGPSTSLNLKGLLSPSIPPDAGTEQGVQALIYLNGVGFHFGWSNHTEDGYRPSPNMNVGPFTLLNAKGLDKPPDDAVVPEFSLSINLLLLMAATLLVVVVHTRKQSNW